jgi:peroxiredoxin
MRSAPAATGGWKIVALAALLLVSASAPSPAAVKAVDVGQPVPDFTLPDLGGAAISFEKDIRGRAPLTLFLFMTTACSACYEELQEISAFVGSNPGKIDAWCVAVDLRGVQTVSPFQQVNRFRVKYLIDPKFSLPRLFGFNYTPSLAIIDSRGILLHKKGGYSPTERLPDLIRTFLR